MSAPTNHEVQSMPPQPEEGPILEQDVHPAIRAADAAFREQLPELLKTHPGEWAAFHGPNLLGFGASQPELYQRYIARGIDPDELLVLLVEPQPSEDSFVMELSDAG